MMLWLGNIVVTSWANRVVRFIRQLSTLTAHMQMHTNTHTDKHIYQNTNLAAQYHQADSNFMCNMYYREMHMLLPLQPYITTTLVQTKFRQVNMVLPECHAVSYSKHSLSCVIHKAIVCLTTSKLNSFTCTEASINSVESQYTYSRLIQTI